MNEANQEMVGKLGLLIDYKIENLVEVTLEGGCGKWGI